MVLPMATGIMLCTIYLPTETGAPSFMPKGTCKVESLNKVGQLEPGGSILQPSLLEAGQSPHGQ